MWSLKKLISPARANRYLGGGVLMSIGAEQMAVLLFILAWWPSDTYAPESSGEPSHLSLVKALWDHECGRADSVTWVSQEQES